MDSGNWRKSIDDRRALAVNGTIPERIACIGILLAFSTNQVSKAVVAWMAGDSAFALRIIPGLLLIFVGLAVGAAARGLLSP